MAAVLGVLGVLGNLLPALPGSPLVLAGLALAAWGDGFERVGWPVLMVLAALTLATPGVDMAAVA